MVSVRNRGHPLAPQQHKKLHVHGTYTADGASGLHECYLLNERLRPVLPPVWNDWSGHQRDEYLQNLRPQDSRFIVPNRVLLHESLSDSYESLPYNPICQCGHLAAKCEAFAIHGNACFRRSAYNRNCVLANPNRYTQICMHMCHD